MNKKTFLITEQVILNFECTASSEAEAKKLYEDYLSTQEGRLEMIETAIQTTWGPNINIEQLS